MIKKTLLKIYASLLSIVLIVIIVSKPEFSETRFIHTLKTNDKNIINVNISKYEATDTIGGAVERGYSLFHISIVTKSLTFEEKLEDYSLNEDYLKKYLAKYSIFDKFQIIYATEKYEEETLSIDYNFQDNIFVSSEIIKTSSFLSPPEKYFDYSYQHQKILSIVLVLHIFIFFVVPEFLKNKKQNEKL